MSAVGAATRCAVLSVGLVVAGLLLGRPDVVALAMPFVIGLVYISVHGPTPTPQVSLLMPVTTMTEREIIEVAIVITAEADIDAVVVALAAPSFRLLSGSRVVSGSFLTVTSVTAGAETVVPVRLLATHWGRQRIGPVNFQFFGRVLLTAASPVIAEAIGVRVLPAIEPFEAAEAVPRVLAYAGSHRSRVPGPGVEFGGIRTFASTDRPRRINWRASLRAGQMQVNTTLTDRASQVLVLVDSEHNAGPPGGGILDVAVRAAIGITDHYLSIGDAVGLVEYGGKNRMLASASGRRQLARAQEWLLDVGPLSAATPPAERWLAGLATAGALVIALSPILDEDAAAHLVVLRRCGAAVVALDTLPDGALPPSTDELSDLARRLWLHERHMLIERLMDLGIPVIRWVGDGSLDLILRDLARMARAPRAVLR